VLKVRGPAGTAPTGTLSAISESIPSRHMLVMLVVS
jgi:hypothetical protein